MKSFPFRGYVLAITLIAASSEAAIRHVPADFATVQAAINASTAGDVVEVAPGIYYENLTIGPPQDGIVVRGTLGATATTINGSAVARCFEIRAVGPNTLIQGFTVRHGLGSGEGGGFLLAATRVTISECVIERNDAGTGGGIYSDLESNPRVLNCVIRNNRATWGSGGGVYADHGGGGTYSFCQINGNTAAGYGGALMASEGARPTLDHCTITGNGAGTAGGNVFFMHNSGGTFTNCLIAFPTQGANVQGGVSPGPSSFSCCDLFVASGANFLFYPSPLGANGNFAANPLFCNAQIGDFGLGSGSPCASANNPVCQLVGAFDAQCGVVPTVKSSWGSIKAAYH